jgi:hypothetical protein
MIHFLKFETLNLDFITKCQQLRSNLFSGRWLLVTGSWLLVSGFF